MWRLSSHNYYCSSWTGSSGRCSACRCFSGSDIHIVEDLDAPLEVGDGRDRLVQRGRIGDGSVVERDRLSSANTLEKDGHVSVTADNRVHEICGYLARSIDGVHVSDVSERQIHQERIGHTG